MQPSQQLYYTWAEPCGPRLLVWEGANTKNVEEDLRKDGGGDYEIEEGNHVYWVSFLNGMQRTLLLTCDPVIAEEAQAAKQLEQVDQEITVSIHGMGLSVVNNKDRKEIIYIGIASSGIIWETCKHDSERFKQMNAVQSESMERAYHQYLELRATGNEEYKGRFAVDSKTEVDFDLNVMYKPSKKKIRRTFLSGFWFQVSTNANVFQLHAKINRLQIDNQMFDCIFPVILAPVPPPKSVAGIDGTLHEFNSKADTFIYTFSSQTFCGIEYRAAANQKQPNKTVQVLQIVDSGVSH